MMGGVADGGGVVVGGGGPAALMVGVWVWVEMACFVFLWVPASRGNDVRLAGMTDGSRE